ncbi:unnamed protein product [Lasius platythorax]|uniref:Uncharacterized protein n=1 Tax=Lasius platythorax TaxID=488582 RepID=A0AAV2MYX1_9HYME
MRKAIACVLTCLEDNAPSTYKGNVSRATRMITSHVEELFSCAMKLELARNYMATRIKLQDGQIRILYSELSILRTSSRSCGCLLQEHSWNISDLSLVAERGLSLRLMSPDRVRRSPSMLRGDETNSSMEHNQLSILGSSVPLGEEQIDSAGGDTLIAELIRVEVSIDRINSEISNKTASLLELDAAADTALANIFSYDLGDD